MASRLAYLGDRLGNLPPRRWLWIALALGMAIRLVVAFAFLNSNNDITSFELVDRALDESPLHVYATVGPVHWPYGPIYFPWILLATAIHNHLGLPFSAVIKLPGIAADAALAWLVTWEMLRSGFRTSVAYTAGCLILLGPTFVINSAYHGQIDSVATLVAVGSLVAWRRVPGNRRALVAGLLAGLAIAIKTPVGLVLVPLLLACRSPREALILAGAATGLVFLLMAPFLAATPHAVLHALTFTDVAGVGGLPLVLKVDLHAASGETFVLNHRAIITLVALIGTAALVWRRREASPALIASVVWLAFYSVGTGFFFGYLVWGIPFFLLAGYVRASAALMVFVLLPTLTFETGLLRGDLTVYDILMTVLWAAFVVAFISQIVRLRGLAGSLSPRGQSVVTMGSDTAR